MAAQSVAAAHTPATIPPEIRDHLYGCVLGIPHTYFLVFGEKAHGTLRKHYRYSEFWIGSGEAKWQLQLFQTCRLLHQEGQAYLLKKIPQAKIMYTAAARWQTTPIPDTFLDTFGDKIRKLDIQGVPHGSKTYLDDFHVFERLPNLELVTVHARYPSDWETDLFQFDGNIKAWVEDREDVKQALMERERVERSTGKSIDCNKYNLSYRYFTDVVERKVMEQRKFTIDIIFEISIKQKEQDQDPVEREFKMHLVSINRPTL